MRSLSWIRIQEGKMTHKNKKNNKFDFLKCFLWRKTSPLA
jgi:hypothetical protein